MKAAEKQQALARAAIKRAVAMFLGKIDRLTVRWEHVPMDHLYEDMLLELCDELAKRIDNPHNFLRGEASIRLSNALADYRDSQRHER
jgi:hypothetical protein